MKKLILVVLLVVGLASIASAEWVNGYTRRDGTYVPGYERSPRNNQKWDNYGSKSNNDKGYGYSSPYSRDSDKDGISNQYDLDDNNNGVADDYERTNIRRW